jgi:DnaJ homolog subfamily C member 28
MSRRYIDRRAEAEIEAMLAREKLARKDDEAAASEQSSRQSAKTSGGARSAGTWQGIVEQRIQDGMERGLFDNLKGTGQPLNLDEDRFVPEELKMAFRMLRSTGLTPLWIEIRKEIQADIERLHRFREHVHSRRQIISAIELNHLRRQYETRLADINGKIMNFNILAPSSQVHMALLLIDEELARFDTHES